MQPFAETQLHELAQLMRGHLPSIAVGIISTILVIYGSPINKKVLKMTKSLPFLGRFALFVFLCSFGYGLVSSQLVKWLRHFLYTLPDGHLVLSVVGAFVVLGFLAKNANEV